MAPCISMTPKTDKAQVEARGLLKAQGMRSTAQRIAVLTVLVEAQSPMTHEEVIALLGLELSSYRDLPQMWYQIQTRFRDEPRPKSGLLRVREFAMKDSYSIDLDDAGLDRSFDLHHHAYVRIFARLGLDAVPVEASSGAMGGSASIEFMVESPAGEDDVARCGTMISSRDEC